jgi:CO/xanthine dehydrogenase Mo-binding subunit
MTAKIGMSGSAAIAQTFPPQPVEQALIAAAEAALPLRIVAGRLINPMIVEGQIHGGVAQGVANALYEEVVYDDGGNLLTGSLADYLVPTMAEIPALEIHHLETLTGASVTGAKGVGEGGTIGAAAAILNAVSDVRAIRIS